MTCYRKNPLPLKNCALIVDHIFIIGLDRQYELLSLGS